jgi:hypothetical protein
MRKEITQEFNKVLTEILAAEYLNLSEVNQHL